MGTFLKKPEKVQAVQWKGNNVADINGFIRELDIPSESYEAVLKRNADIILYFKGEEGRDTLIFNSDSYIIVPHGCYLVIDKYGEMEVMSEEYFEEQFDVYFEDLEKHA